MSQSALHHDLKNPGYGWKPLQLNDVSDCCRWNSKRATQCASESRCGSNLGVSPFSNWWRPNRVKISIVPFCLRTSEHLWLLSCNSLYIPQIWFHGNFASIVRGLFPAYHREQLGIEFALQSCKFTTRWLHRISLWPFLHRKALSLRPRSLSIW